MDLQTMLKKVKQKQYKSKREFHDDLDLIWSNCFTYNAADVSGTHIFIATRTNANNQNHPLRQCARRLKAKAESLLKNITDRKERTDPVIPLELGHPQSHPGPMSVRIRLNGATGGAHIVNGAINGHDRRSSIPSVNGVAFAHTSLSRASPPIGVARVRHVVSRSSPTSTLTRSPSEIPFADSPALVRTQEGMTLFNTIDKDLEYVLKNIAAEKPKAELMNALMELAPPYDYYEGMDDPVVKTEPDVVEHLGVEVGEKRKPYVPPCFLGTSFINPL